MRSIAFDLAPCQCVSEHRPLIVWCHIHHILPLEHGGADHPDNEVSICPPLHDQIHVVLRASKKAGKLVSRPLGYNLYGYDLAKRGWVKMQEAGVV